MNGYELDVWDLRREQLLASFTSEQSPASCDFAPDGGIVVVGTHSGLVHFLRLEGRS